MWAVFFFVLDVCGVEAGGCLLVVSARVYDGPTTAQQHWPAYVWMCGGGGRARTGVEG